MGGGTFDPGAYRAFTSRTASLKTDEIYSSRDMDKTLDPLGVKIRESRDSADNPNSTPIIIGIDVTGSMGILAETIARKGLGTLFTGILDRKPVSDPHVMFMGIGDANCDRAPLQVSQFEADKRIIEQLTKIWIEHGGGGNGFESYNLPWYFAAFHTEHDAMVKRGKRGYLFTVGDEEAPGDLTAAQIKRFIGDEVAQHLSTKDVLELAQRKYDVYHVVIEEGSHFRSHPAKVRQSWNDLLGQKTIYLADHQKLSETIVSVIEVAEGRDADGSAKAWGGDTARIVHEAVKNAAERQPAQAARSAVMRARVVIGANFGDEGKGLATDYLCAREGAGVVVRFNGGAQAGHTVVTPDGKRHVFGHLGSGSFLGIPTFLSQYFICNPIVFFRELGDFLDAGGQVPHVYAHPDCLVTTFADMIINQRKEEARGDKRHGSVGLGINETVNRSEIPSLRITMSDLWNRSNSIESKLAEICDKYAFYRTGSPIDEPKMIEAFIQGCWKFADAISPAGIGQCKDPVFEGAQGLLLDQDNKEFFPHVTRSSTGAKNAKALCSQAGLSADFYYVSRTYLTRHGAGKLPGEDASLSYADDTNLEHAWQGTLRFAPLDSGLMNRCAEDSGGEFRLIMTHADQCPAQGLEPDLISRGPTRLDVTPTARMLKVA